MQVSGKVWWGALLATALSLTAAPIAATADAPEDVRIHDIQGTSRVSPLDGQRVSAVPGVVTAVRAFGSARGFWVQDPRPDGDPRTSEGLFVFTGRDTPRVSPGDELTVTGTVKEYYPGDQDEGFQSLTELVDAEWHREASGTPVPAPETLDPDTVPGEFVRQPGGDIDPLPLEPGRYALDFYESREGMRVRVDDARVVGPSTEYHELYVTSKPEQNANQRGGTVYSGYSEQNGGRLKVESLIPFSERPFPEVNVGDELAGVTEGPLDYDRYGGYTLQATALGEVRSNELRRQTTRQQRSGELSVATYNVENLSPGDDAAKFEALAKGITTNLASPDIVTLEEIQDNTGPADDGVVAADKTLGKLTDAITDAGGPSYEWRQIDPVNNADGGQPGGNIRVAFLFDPQRVSFVDRTGGDATTAVRVEKHRGKPRLSISPGRIAPDDPAWDDARKPLAGEFRFGKRTVFVVANHFSSKYGDQPLHGRIQPPERSSEKQRVQQAEVVREFTDELLRADRNANVVVAGDLNDFQFSPALAELTGGGLRNLVNTLPEQQRYSYVYEGNSQVLDHILASSAPRGVDYQIVHTNAEFADQVSDHDPQVVRFRPGTGVPWLDAFYDTLDRIERITGEPTWPPRGHP